MNSTLYSLVSQGVRVSLSKTQLYYYQSQVLLCPSLFIFLYYSSLNQTLCNHKRAKEILGQREFVECMFPIPNRAIQILQTDLILIGGISK